MATRFAKIDPTTGEVLNVIVADQAFINSGKVGDPKLWVQTWKDESRRKNYAGRGHIYDKNLDAFIPPKPFNSWSLNETTAKWEPPKARPTDGKLYRWDEQKEDWVVRDL